jgi:F1F0 ATPase subunit 2
MNSASLVIGVAVGLGLSVVFYGGLWITIRRLLVTRHPVAVTLGSMVFRTALTLAGVVLVARGQWQNALACVAGFVIGRIVVSRLVLACT